MSIIYDALKKVGKSLHQAQAQKEKNLPLPTFKIKIYLTYALIIFLGVVAAKIFFDLFIPSAEIKTADFPTAQKASLAKIVTTIPAAVNTQAPALTGPPMPTKESTVASPPKEEQRPLLPALVLNGVFFSEEKGYALINNRIAKEGDNVEGATVEKVTLEGVKLKFQNTTINLSTSSQ